MADDTPRGRDELIVAALIGGATTAEAAQVAQCSESTVVRTRRTWRGYIDAEQAARYASASRKLLDTVPRAVWRLSELIDSRNESVAIAACKAVLAMAAEWRVVSTSAGGADTDLAVLLRGLD